MIKRDISRLGLTLYEEKLDNGLRVFVIPKNNCNNIYVTFSTKYGSNVSEFIPINSKVMKKFPYGIAHFLEHKLFEQEDGSDPFTFYSENGCDANANTSNYKTTYLFSGPLFFKENINYLIDYVQKPYFTDLNVLKEQGIIIQEIKMYQDDPYSVLYEKAIYDSFIKHPIKIPVIGDIENIKKITKEDLYCCYETFYHPSNMFIVVTGNVDPIETIKIISDNQKGKNFNKIGDLKLKMYNEPDNVEVLNDVIRMDVNIPKIAISYKVNYKKLGLDLRSSLTYLSLIFDINFGTTSIFNERLREKNIVVGNIEFSLIHTDKHILISIFGESNNKDKFISSVLKQMEKLSIDVSSFERKKKNLACSYIYMSDNIFSMNEKVMNNIINYDMVNIDWVEYYENLDFKTANDILSDLDLSNYNVVSIEP